MTVILRAIRLDVDGTLTDLELPAGDARAKALRDAVGGWAETAHYSRPDGKRRVAVVVNADGRDTQPENLFATSLINAIRLSRLPYCLHGPVVLLGAPNGAGEHTDVPEPLRGVLPQIVAVLATRYTPATS
ncbi:hypothetical protein ACWD6R_16440 [Streptomyces sp. NPDC005151]